MKMGARSRALDKIYKRRDRYEIPEWQRQEVWGKSKKQNLIDSILRDWTLPKFYFLKTNETPEAFEVVDGQQRLVAIWEFMDGELELSEPTAKMVGASTYEGLPDAIQDAFDDYEIQYDVVEDSSDEEVREFFQRLQSGLPLTASEKLNSISSKLRDYVSKQTNHDFFQKKLSMSDRRYGYFDVAVKAAAIEIDGLEVGTRFDDLAAVLESQASFSPNSNVAKKIGNTLDFLNSALPARSPALRNRTIVQSLITLAARVVATGKSNGLQKSFWKFFESFLDELGKQVELGNKATDQDYITFQRTINANVRTGPKIRQEILLRKLFAYDPAFGAIFDSSVIAESGMSQQIKLEGIKIREQVTEKNASYSSVHGKDLIKMTNKTAPALQNIGSEIADFEDYKRFIDDLYFVFHEGVGQRLENSTPKSFSDIRDLRTALDHDVDHGKQSKVKKKKIALGETFKKYSGETAPEALDPDRFKIVQANILGAVRSDLEQLVVETT
jgi:hypothetical protein